MLKSEFIAHLNQQQLSLRWGVSPRTLERWRWTKVGPKYIRIGNRVMYRLCDIEAYEEQQSHSEIPRILTREGYHA